MKFIVEVEFEIDNPEGNIAQPVRSKAFLNEMIKLKLDMVLTQAIKDHNLDAEVINVRKVAINETNKKR